jgi:AraC-like DNA-binding protein
MSLFDFAKKYNNVAIWRQRMKAVLALDKTSWSKQYTPSIETKSMLYYVQSAGIFNCREGYMTDREDYETYLLAYTYEGLGNLEYRDRKYQLGKGDCFLICCRDHQVYYTDNNELWKFIWVHFNGSNILSYYQKIYQNSGAVYKMGSESIVLKNMESIISMTVENNINLQFIASKLIVEILTEIVLLNNKSESNTDNINEHIEITVNKIEENFSEHISLAKMADWAKMSKYHFSRTFKNITGYSPYEYLKNCRLNNAKQLLKLTDKSVGEISQKVGFESVSNFIKTFKKSEDITPNTFRNYWRQ